MEQSRGFSTFSDLHRNDLRRSGSEVLSCRVTHLERSRETVQYRGYSLQIGHASHHWQVLIDVMAKDRRALPPEKQLVKGWDEEDLEACENADRSSD